MYSKDKLIRLHGW